MEPTAGFDFQWLDQIQSAGILDLENDAALETGVCSAEFQQWLDGSDMGLDSLDDLDVARINSLPSQTRAFSPLHTAPNDAAPASGITAGVGGLPHVGVSSGAGAQEAENLKPNNDWAVKQEAIDAHNNRGQSQQQQVGAQQELPQQQWRAQGQQYMAPQAGQQHILLPLQQPGVNFSTPAPAYGPAGVADGCFDPQELVACSGVSGLPLSTTMAPAYTAPHSTGLGFSSSGSSGLLSFTPPPRIADPSATVGAPAFSAPGWGQPVSTAVQCTAPPAATAPPARRSGRDSSKSRPGPRARSRSVADSDDADFLGPAISKSGVASRRFRARQKQLMLTLEDELTAKLSQLQMLETENESLKLKETVLAAAVEAGESQMSILQHSGPSVYDSKQLLLEQARQRSQGLPGHITPDTPPNSTNTVVTGGSGSMPAAGDGSSSTADSSRSGAADDSPSRAQQQQQPQHNTSAADADVAQAVKCMTTDDMLVSWKQFLKDLSRELMNLQIEAAAAQASATATTAADCAAPGAGGQLPPAEVVGGPLAAVGHGQHFGSATPAAQRLSALVQRNSTLMKLACALNPGAYFKLFGRHIDTNVPAAYSDDHWKKVIAQINLSDEQVKAVLVCADLYFSHMARLQQERTLIKAQLKQSDVAKEDLLIDTGLNPGSPWLIGLQSNLKREHMLRIMLNRFAYDRLLSPLQAAKLCVYSHPLYPDWHAIICVLRDMIRGPASAANLMAAATAAAKSCGSMTPSDSDADLQQRLLKWREVANSSLSLHAKTHLTPGMSLYDLL